MENHSSEKEKAKEVFDLLEEKKKTMTIQEKKIFWLHVNLVILFLIFIIFLLVFLLLMQE